VLVVTPGEPAGIGPDLLVTLAQQGFDCSVVAVADPELLSSRARRLGFDLGILPPGTEPAPPGSLRVLPVPLAGASTPGTLDTANAHYVLATLRAAVAECSEGRADALVTGPVHKGVINDAGVAFTGHTEFLAAQTGTPRVVMMLCAVQGLLRLGRPKAEPSRRRETQRRSVSVTGSRPVAFKE